MTKTAWHLRYQSGASFLEDPHKRVMLIGMSGVGKTHLSRCLIEEDWFHYSVDYRIGTRYLSEQILDLAKTKMMGDPFLKSMLRRDSMFLGLNLTVDNLHAISCYVGLLGNPARGGLDLETFMQRQQAYAKAERSAMNDIEYFIRKAESIYGYPHFVVDTTGSFCELFPYPLPHEDPILKLIARKFLLVYMEASESDVQAIIKRQMDDPKPMNYHASFLANHLRHYLKENNLKQAEDCDPKLFLRNIITPCLEHRHQHYAALCARYGVTVKAEDFAKVAHAHDVGARFVEIIAHAIDRNRTIHHI